MSQQLAFLTSSSRSFSASRAALSSANFCICLSYSTLSAARCRAYSSASRFRVASAAARLRASSAALRFCASSAALRFCAASAASRFRVSSAAARRLSSCWKRSRSSSRASFCEAACSRRRTAWALPYTTGGSGRRVGQGEMQSMCSFLYVPRCSSSTSCFGTVSRMAGSSSCRSGRTPS